MKQVPKQRQSTVHTGEVAKEKKRGGNKKKKKKKKKKTSRKEKVSVWDPDEL